MSNKVAPLDPNAAPAFKKPVPAKPRGGAPQMTSYDPLYLERKKSVGSHTFKCKSGQEIGYFAEGNPQDPAVLCLHGMTQCKWLYLFPAPLPGVYQIAVDRPGHGLSTPIEKSLPFSGYIAPIMELLDELKIAKFYVKGLSMGAATAIQIAAAHPDRVLGCAPVSGPGEQIGTFNGQAATFNPDISKEALSPSLIFALAKPGCWGGFSRCLLGPVFKTQCYPSKTKDPGFASVYKGYQSKGCGGTEQMFERMDKDQFYISKMMDCHLHGIRSPLTALYELQTVHDPAGFSYDYKNIKCPTFVYNGKEELTPLSMAQMYHKCIPGSELIVMQEHGHASIVLESEEIILALVQGKAWRPA